MNVYDFDNTIYDGESIVDFYIFLLKKDFSLVSLFPKMLYMLLKYKLCLISEDELFEKSEKNAAVLFSRFDNLQLLVSEFWDKNQHKIKSFYLKNKRCDDIILSANCSFLLEEIANRLGVSTLISSVIDPKSGKISRLCFKSKKAEIFRNLYPDCIIDNFFTDSMNDESMFGLANHIFIVKGNVVKEMIK